MATQRECVHVRRVPHMRCVMRATAVRACACVVTLYTIRSVRYQQRLRARARTRPPSPCAHLLFLWKCAEGKSSRSAVLHYRTTAGPGSRSRPKGSKPGQRAQDPDPTHAAWRRLLQGIPGWVGKKAEAALAKMATQRECVHVRRVPHMRCVMRATAVRACACVVTLYTLRSVRYQQRLRARARTRPPSPCAHLLFFCGNARKESRRGRQSYTTELPQDQGRAADQRGRNPASAHKTLIQPILPRRPSGTVNLGQAIRRRPRPSADDLSPRGSPRGVPPWGPPVFPPGHPHADDLRAIRMQTTYEPSVCRRPPGHPHADDLRAIRMQTTSGPSACRRPPGHPHADDLRAIRMQTTFRCVWEGVPCHR